MKSIWHDISDCLSKSYVKKDTKYIRMHHSRQALFYQYVRMEKRTSPVCLKTIVDEDDDEE